MNYFCKESRSKKKNLFFLFIYFFFLSFFFVGGGHSRGLEEAIFFTKNPKLT